MADDSFFREVDEQIRQDRARELWAKYGNYLIALAVLIVIATAAWRFWEYYTENQAAAFGDAYLEALALSEAGDHDAAIAELERISAEGSGQYPALARLRIAGEMAEKGDKKAAIAAFDAIAGDDDFREVFRDIARLRAGLLAVDLADYATVKTRLAPLAEAGGAFRHSAREALGIAAIKAGERDEAVEWLQAIVHDTGAVAGVRSRAEILLDHLAGQGVTPSA